MMTECLVLRRFGFLTQRSANNSTVITVVMSGRMVSYPFLDYYVYVKNKTIKAELYCNIKSIYLEVDA